jgi:hypothetical protein
MSDTTRRDVLAGAAGISAGSMLALPAPAVARTEPVDAPFRIEPSANYIEFRRLAKLSAEAHRLRYATGDERYEEEWSSAWHRLQALLKEMTAEPPRTPSDILDYAAVFLWCHASIFGDEDPCEAINDHGQIATEREHSSYDLAWAIFSLAADRTTPARRGEWKPPRRVDPDL